MKRILFPTDFSDAANNAFIYALEIAKAFRLPLTTLHVYQLPDISQVHLPHTLREVYDSIELEEFENFKNQIPVLRKLAEKHGLADVPLENMMEEGPTVPTIINTAKKTEAELIIMGTQGATGLSSLLFGSNTAEVMENAPCPVLGVPEKARFDGKIDHIAVAIDLDKDETAALEYTLRFARPFKAQLHCLNVNTSQVGTPEEKMEELRKRYQNSGLSCRFEILKGDRIYEPLSQYVEEHQIDLLVMLTHQRNFLQELFDYSKTKKMIYQAKMPILSIPENWGEGLS